MASFDVWTVREMIDGAFGETDNSCPVNCNMVGSVLYILARRMELLKRHFKVEMREILEQKTIVPKSTFVVTEIKIHTKGKKKSRKARPVEDGILPLDKMQRAPKGSRFTGHKKLSRQRFYDDNSSDMPSAEERSMKESATHKRSGDKYSQKRRPAKIHRSERPEAGKYSDDESQPERRIARQYSDETSPAIRQRAYKGRTTRTAQRKAEKYSEEEFSGHKRKSEKFPAGRRKARQYSDDDMSPTERREARRSPHQSAERRKTGKRTPSERSGVGNDYSPSDEPSSESAISGRKDRKGKTDAEGRSMAHAGRFKERGSHEIKRKYERASDDDDLEEQHEKIYVVTRTPSGRKIRPPNVTINPVVTQEQFNQLLAKTRKLQSKFGIKQTSIKTKWDNLRETTSITDPKAALNMSVRLDRAESRLARLLEIVTQLASEMPEIDLQAGYNETALPRKARRHTEIAGSESGVISGTSEAVLKLHPGTESFQTSGGYMSVLAPDAPGSQSTTAENNVTRREFNDELEMLQNDLFRDINQAIADTRAQQCGRTLGGTELRVNRVYKNFQRLAELSYAVEKFGKGVMATDEYISSQMALFQDTLLRMETDLEIALDKLADSLTSPKEDAAAVAQITETFNEFKGDLVGTDFIQIELKQDIENYNKNLISIMKKIEQLRNRKCTREQMYEALSDKLSLKDINGLLTHDQFDAVMSNNRETFQNIQMKIFTKECDWQHTIDLFLTKCWACADITQTETLNKSLQQCFTRMDTDLNQMFSIILPSKKYPTDKKVQRNDNCLSCGMPAETRKDELSLKIWQEILSTTDPAAALERMKFKYEEITGICIPGRPVPHPLEQGSFICEHDCGEIVETMEVLELFVKKLHPDSQTNREAVSDKSQVEDR